jgi:hypothetical protein
MLVDPERSDLRIERLTGNAELRGGSARTCDAASRGRQGSLDDLSFRLRLEAVLLRQRRANGNAGLGRGLRFARQPRFVDRKRVALAQNAARSTTFCNSRMLPGQSYA